MAQSRRPLPSLVVVALALVVTALVFVLGMYVLAIVGPLVGAAFAWVRLHIAWAMWRSDGRFPVGDAIHIIEPARARWLALAEVGSAVATLVAGAVPALLLFVSPFWAVGAGVSAVLLFGVFRRARNRLHATSQPIEVLPPEQQLDD